MLWNVLALTTLVVTVVAGAPRDNETTTGTTKYTTTDPQQCLNDLVEWCENMKYPKGNNSVGMSMTSVTMADSNGVFRVLCVSDNEGTNCSKNGEQWFACNKDNQFSYKGSTYTGNSSLPADDDGDICRTAENAFNDLSIRNLFFDNDTFTRQFEKGMEQFFISMANMHEQLANVRARLSRMFPDCFPFCGQPRRQNPFFGYGHRREVERDEDENDESLSDESVSDETENDEIERDI